MFMGQFALDFKKLTVHTTVLQDYEWDHFLPWPVQNFWKLNFFNVVMVGGKFYDIMVFSTQEKTHLTPLRTAESEALLANADDVRRQVKMSLLFKWLNTVSSHLNHKRHLKSRIFQVLMWVLVILNRCSCRCRCASCWRESGGHSFKTSGLKFCEKELLRYWTCFIHHLFLMEKAAFCFRACGDQSGGKGARASLEAISQNLVQLPNVTSRLKFSWYFSFLLAKGDIILNMYDKV